MKLWIHRTLFAGLFSVLPMAPALHAAEITVSAAISMKDALTDAGKTYEKTSGDHVAFNFLASGPLMKQIEQGAPVDLFISAAHEQMDELQQKGLIDPASRQDVVGNDLVLIMPANSTIAPPTSIDEIKDSRFQRIAIGEPATVPAGQYAKQSLTSLKLMNDVQSRLKTGANVRQVLEYVERSEVDLGFVYRTDAVQAGDKVKIAATVPNRSHEPIIYPGAIIAHSTHAADATKFFQYLLSPEGRATLTRYGFSNPTNATTQAKP